MKASESGVGLATTLATWFGCGLSPFAPGTAGSLGAMVPVVLLSVYADAPGWWFAVAAAAIFAPAVWSAGVVERHLGTEDPQRVVVDEVVGQWIAIAGATTMNWKSWLAAFVLFRLFDIWKPPPVRQLENLHGGLGIVADDAMAGLYGAVILFAAGHLGLY